MEEIYLSAMWVLEIDTGSQSTPCPHRGASFFTHSHSPQSYLYIYFDPNKICSECENISVKAFVRDKLV